MQIRAATAVLLALYLMSRTLMAAPLVPPEDANQSINYWKPHVIAPGSNEQVARAHEVFSRLLRTWDGARIEPSLYVVKSDSGPWAASLLDGNILLSYQAIKICNRFGKAQAQDLLAFVLAHELAHQRSNDLWHQKFFRLAGSLAPGARKNLLKGISSLKTVKTLARREAQADIDGLTIMSVVGYDPFRIVDKKDFFTQWVESIWEVPCVGSGASKAVVNSCSKAKTRALRARTQLKTVAVQAVLYDLGVQAYISGRNDVARRYFRAYGRDYPSRAVYSAIGLTYLAEALDLRKNLLDRGQLTGPQFFYPLVLDASPTAQRISQPGSGKKRGVADGQAKKQKKQIKKLAAKAYDYFEKSRRLEPNHKNTYLLAAIAQLVKGNTYVARGVVQGELMLRFGRDLETDMLMAIIHAREGKLDEAGRLFKALARKITSNTRHDFVLPKELVSYAIHHNYAAMETFRGNRKLAKKIWQRMARQSKASGESLLFRMAVRQINNSQNNNVTPHFNNIKINNKKIGDSAKRGKTSSQYSQASDFWYEGEHLKFYRYENGTRMVLGSNKKVMSIWQEPARKNSIGKIAIGDDADRPLKVYGLPSRTISVVSGDYLAYDDLGLALHIVSGRVNGWFLYDPAS